MKLKNILSEGASPAATKIVMDALNAVDKHTNTDVLKPYYKNVKLSHPRGQENLLNITFRFDPGTSSGALYTASEIDRRHREGSKNQKLIARELEDQLKKTIDVEDSEVSVGNRSVTLFVVSDDFVK